MSNSSMTVAAIKNSQLDTNSVTPMLINTHCIVCGTAFPMARAGKLYCSSRCKQFGYNHKSQIFQTLTAREKGIRPTPVSFYIDDFNDYSKTQKMVKRYKELEKKRREWDVVNQEIKLCDNAGISVRNSTWDHYAREKPTEEDQSELYHYECNLEDDTKGLNLKDLSIEQWSFIKYQQPGLDRSAFFLFSSTLSREFMDQLRLGEVEIDNQLYTIRNKFVNHCNLIAEGIIKFVVKDEEDKK